MAKPKFLRRGWFKKPRLGRKRKKKQVWRKPKGRHTKTRLKRRGYPKQPSIGYGKERKERGKIEGLKPILIHNVNEMYSVKKDNIAFISASVGMLKKAEIAKKAIELGIKLANLDAEKFLEKIAKEKIKEKTKEEKKAEEKKGKEEKKEEEKEKVEEKKAEEKEKAEEEKEEKEKKEKEKILRKEIPKIKHEVAKPKKAVKAPLMRKALEK